MRRRAVVAVVCLPMMAGFGPAGVAALDDCLGSINELVAKEAVVADTGVVRTYALCGETVYTIAPSDYFGELLSEDGQQRIPLRPNLHLKCGASGARENNCLIMSGDVQLDGTNFFGVGSETVDNVVIEGLTFLDGGKYQAWINKPGNVVFRNCEFRENVRALTPVLLDYFDPNSQNTELSVTFQYCDFMDNRFAGFPAQPALVVGNGMQNRLFIQNCNFNGNNMLFNNTMSDKISFLVETSGPLEMVGNCFEENLLGVAPVAVYGNQFFAADNYAGPNAAGSRCQFGATFTTAAAYQQFTPQCSAFDAQRCAAAAQNTTRIPTLVPTSVPTAPTVSPTDGPSHSPSASPTLTVSPTRTTPEPTFTASSAPTGGTTTSEPSAAVPTATLSKEPVSTLSPTRTPTEQPSESPVKAPTFSVESDPSNGSSSGGRLVSVCAVLSWTAFTAGLFLF